MEYLINAVNLIPHHIAAAYHHVINGTYWPAILGLLYVSIRVIIRGNEQ